MSLMFILRRRRPVLFTVRPIVDLAAQGLAMVAVVYGAALGLALAFALAKAAANLLGVR